MKKHRIVAFSIIVIVLFGIFFFLTRNGDTKSYDHKVVVCVPVFGQSLALGEEAVRITDFDSLRIKYDGRIVNENLDYEFGCYSDKKWKRAVKRFINDHRHSFELSLYRMAESLVTELGKDTVICIFPGGLGETPIHKLNKEFDYLYPIFISDIRNAFEKAAQRGWDFYVPAICWMQGESDIVDYTDTDYKQALKSISEEFNKDIKAITNQKDDVHIVCYQPNVLTLAKEFNRNKYDCIETRVCQSIVNLIHSDTLFWASGPTYPYQFVNENVHIDAIGQQHIGDLAANAVLQIIRNGNKTYGVIPIDIKSEQNDVIVRFSVPQPPLIFDTVSVKPIGHYGFSVITKEGKDIVSEVVMEKDNAVRIMCTESPNNCKVRYAVNGEKFKSGFAHGPRGNLRDSHLLRNWCYQFDQICY